MEGNGPKLTKMDRSGLEWTKVDQNATLGKKKKKL